MESDVAIASAALGGDAALAALFLARSARRRRPPRTVLHRSSDLSRLSYLLLDGAAHEAAYGRSGQVLVLWRFLAGDMFGDVLEQEAEAADRETIGETATETACFPSETLFHFMEAHPSVALAVSRYFVRRLGEARHRVVETGILSATGRVHAELLRMGRLADDYLIRPAPNVSELALRVSTARETASRAISALEKRGVIRRQGDGLKIVAPHRLEGLID